tara:strand:+ start:279 stop:470 length:192 start_codon:yes stop_codon:yes gene_type:complete
MIIVPVKEGENIERALKKYKKKFERTGVLKELRNRKHYTKKSVLRRQQIIKAQYLEHLRNKEA